MLCTRSKLQRYSVRPQSSGSAGLGEPVCLGKLIPQLLSCQQQSQPRPCATSTATTAGSSSPAPDSLCSDIHHHASVSLPRKLGDEHELFGQRSSRLLLRGDNYNCRDQDPSRDEDSEVRGVVSTLHAECVDLSDQLDGLSVGDASERDHRRSLLGNLRYGAGFE